MAIAGETGCSPSEDIKSARICSKHFISGKCARLKDNQNPDWVPSLNLGYKTVPLVPENILRTQPKGSKNVDVKSVETKENVSANIMAPENYGAYQDTASEELVLDNVFEENASAKRGENQCLDFSHQEDMDQLMLVTENEENGNDDSYVEETSSYTVGTQTDLWMIEIDDSQLKLKEVQFTLDLRDAKIAALQKQLENTKMGIESFRNDDVKTNYFTGLPLFLTLFTLYNAIESNIPFCLLKNLNKFQVLILTLVKLRLNLPFKLLGYIFGISTQTASKKFHECILVLNMEMNAFIRWPDRNARTYFTPNSFKQLFGDRLAVIIDCFEIRIEMSY
ncbi:uncharacterized protein LOC129921018 [Episyrphus balteatus]|uniref:uncharacterized protein LOC129921018 n=1 Tax=Episyrphus balteatus TaxID=286459 RepID=UPI0024862E0D|nr:uncharacterized protein LOC129921018 [Episyrphus balteatus]